MTTTTTTTTPKITKTKITTTTTKTITNESRYKALLYETLSSFISRTTKLLEQEKADDIALIQEAQQTLTHKQLSEQGVCLRHVQCVNIRTGLYGRTMCDFSVTTEHKFGVGDLVEIVELRGKGGSGGGDANINTMDTDNDNNNNMQTAIVSKNSSSSLQLVFEEPPTLLQINHYYTLMLLIDTITYQRYEKVLHILSKPDMFDPGIHTRSMMFCSEEEKNNYLERMKTMINITNFIPENKEKDEEDKEEEEGGKEDQMEEKKLSETNNNNNNNKNKKIKNIAWVNQYLNSSQHRAILTALHTPLPLFLIHGPPGTGKTTTVIEFMLQALLYHSKINNNNNGGNSSGRYQILACAPSNIAVDNMVEKLSQFQRQCQSNPQQYSFQKPLKIVRLGHPARILDDVLSQCLDSLVENSEDKQLCNDIRNEINQKLKEVNKNFKDKTLRNNLRNEIRLLRKDLRKYEERVVTRILDECDIVLCTLTGAAMRELKSRTFDLCVIDEAAQALEVACWIPILKAKRTVLAGDHKQLPPTIKSKKADELSFTLFDRAHQKFGEDITTMLDTQYRMNNKICSFFSNELYNGKLKSHKSVANHVLKDLPYLKSASNKEDDEDGLTRSNTNPLMLIDTNGFDMFEDVVEENESKRNKHEALLVQKHVTLLLEHNRIKPQDIAVISPYRAQVQLIRELIPDRRIEIGTVDGFQGREKEAIIISMVRSNDELSIGFLKDDRRTNVAVTRARRHCALFLDSGTLNSHPFLHDLIDYCYANADVRMADEYEDDDWSIIDAYVEPVSMAAMRTNITEKKAPKKKQLTEEESKEKSEEQTDSKVKKLSKAQKKKQKKKQLKKERANEDQSNPTMQSAATQDAPLVVESKQETQQQEKEKEKEDDHDNDDDEKTSQHNTIESNDTSNINEDTSVDTIPHTSEKEEIEEMNIDIEKVQQINQQPQKKNHQQQQQQQQKQKQKQQNQKQNQNQNQQQQKQKQKANNTSNEKKPSKSQSQQKGPKTQANLHKMHDEMEKKEKFRDDDKRFAGLIPKDDQKLCAVPTCKTKVHLIKQDCKYCWRIFCLTHADPIFHSKICEDKQKRDIEKGKKKQCAEIDRVQEYERGGGAMANPKPYVSEKEKMQWRKQLREKIDDKQHHRKKKSQQNAEKEKENKHKRPGQR